jgi:hypothetical protein
MNRIIYNWPDAPPGIDALDIARRRTELFNAEKDRQREILREIVEGWVAKGANRGVARSFLRFGLRCSVQYLNDATRLQTAMISRLRF